MCSRHLKEAAFKKVQITYGIGVISIAKTRADIETCRWRAIDIHKVNSPYTASRLNLKIKFTKEFPALNYIKCKQ